jgi:hypothetical protein
MNRMKRNYQRLKISALPSVPAKVLFACWMLLLATPAVSFSQEFVATALQPLKRSILNVTTRSIDVHVVPLRVKLTSFTAKELSKGKVVLNWNTAQEQNFSHFTIEKSLDGTDFSDAGIIFSMDDSEQSRAYSFTDKLKAGEAGTIYYRLKMVDVDGKSQLSATKTVKMGEEKEKVAGNVRQFINNNSAYNEL